jgi:general secretion pathway protein G
MKSFICSRWCGVLSLIWVCVGFFALKLSHFNSGSAALTFFVMFGAWWGVALLLAVSGLRSRSTPSVLSALATFVLFLGLLWMMLIPRSIKEPRRAPIAAAQTQIATFRTALDSFRADNGFYPTGSNALQGLLERPAGAPIWRGPYLASDSISKDPWGHDYIYACPGRHNTNSYDLSSTGPPRERMPIANWDRVGLRP